MIVCGLVAACDSTAAPTAGPDRANHADVDAAVDLDGLELVDVRRLGARGDGSTDDTEVLQRAALEHRRLFFPEGVYVVSQLRLEPDTIVVGTAGSVVKGTPGGGAGAVLVLAAGNRIDTLEVDGNAPHRSSGDCIAATRSPGIELHEVHAHDCARAAVALVVSDHYTVTRGQFERAQNACLDLNLSSDGSVVDNTIAGCGFGGVQWWGGDSATSATPGIFDLRIIGNRVTEATGCIWGSLGSNVLVTGNSVEACSDVGIDLEGTFDSIVVDNQVRNSINGGITTFYGSSRVTIENNTIVQEAGQGPGIKLFGNGLSREIAIVGNDIHTATAIGIQTDPSVVTDLAIRDNSIRVDTVSVGVRLLDVGHADVIGNQIAVTGPTGLAFEGPSRSTVADNDITSSADASAAGAGGGILLAWRSSAYPTKNNTVSNNRVRGFVSSVNDACWGDLASGNVIDGNGVDSIYRKAGAGWTGVARGNHTLTIPSVPVDAVTY